MIRKHWKECLNAQSKPFVIQFTINGKVLRLTVLCNPISISTQPYSFDVDRREFLWRTLKVLVSALIRISSTVSNWLTLQSLSIKSPDYGNSHDAALLQLRRAGEQPDVQPVWSRGHLGLLLCALAEQKGVGPCHAGCGTGHLQRGLYLVPHLPVRPER